ncbi:hypothetical protein FPHYL_1482 [Fusarium phyllophilum]|uniref:Uncharacterized protein n=1 Tax=Fusarium phyllophilum TaxID=47803 RepID=A0A8H5KCY1_9HYPO|nr:hypothetical protein FPHYL_1482 [Fusarium phyllophilum]
MTQYVSFSEVPFKPALRQDTHHEELPSNYNDIEPLEDFDLNTAEPVQTRPWKPKYHLTMGLEKCTFSDIIPIDKTLEERLALRRKIVSEHSDMVIASEPSSEAAVKEFYAKLSNWNISIGRDLFEPRENPLTVLPLWLMGWIRTVFDWLGIEALQMKSADLDPEEMNTRCERQTLHRLMENDNTLVFSFKTYQYPLKQIRDEGGGPALAEAIRGINRGSVPTVEWYKASPYWGRAAMEYLRGGSSEEPGEICK